MISETHPSLTEEEKAKLRREIEYVLVVNREFTASTQKPSRRLNRLLEFLSNGFVLLIVGALITSFLVPGFQRAHEERKKLAELKQGVFEEFQIYRNSIWEEYYLMVPLVNERSIDKAQYNEYLEKISNIKLARYNAYSKLVGQSIVFRSQDKTEKSAAEKEMRDYAIKVNAVSSYIDTWLRHLYCLGAECINITAEEKQKSSYAYFLGAKSKMQQILRDGDNVSQTIVRSM